jgi:lariat debranching enzyme
MDMRDIVYGNGGEVGEAVEDVADNDVDDELGELLAAELARDGEEVNNPDEIMIEEDEELEEVIPQIPNKLLKLSAPAPNPEEIHIEDDEFDDDPPAAALLSSTSMDTNAEAGPSKVRRDLEVDESADLVEAVRKEEGETAVEGVIGVTEEEAGANLVEKVNGSSSKGSGRRTKFLALDKCGPGKDFIQVSPLQ